MPICKHCGSPSRHNPCWFEFTPDGAALTAELRGNLDPPCMGDSYDDNMRELSRDRRKAAAGVAAVFVALCIGAAWMFK